MKKVKLGQPENPTRVELVQTEQFWFGLGMDFSILVRASVSPLLISSLVSLCLQLPPTSFLGSQATLNFLILILSSAIFFQEILHC